MTWNKLIDAIKAAGGPTYQYRADRPGRRPRTAARPAATSARASCSGPTAGCRSSTARAARRPTRPRCQDAQGPAADVQPGPHPPDDPAFDDSRKPLAGEFTWKGKTLIVVANHFNSKGGDDPLFGHRQPPVRVSEDQRHAQATDRQRVRARHPARRPARQLRRARRSQRLRVLRHGEILAGPADAGPVRPAAAERALLVRVRRQLAGARPHPGLAALLFPLPEYDSVHVNAEFTRPAVRPRPAGRAAAVPTRSSPPNPGSRDVDPGGGTESCSGARRRGARQRLRGGRLGGLARAARRSASTAPGRRRRSAWPSRGSRCTDSRRSLPKRSTEMLKQAASTPWRRLSHSSVVTARGS